MNLPQNKFGLTLEQNPQKTQFISVGQWLDVRDETGPDFENDEAREQAISTEELWVLQWFPDSSAGSYYIAAPSLEGVLRYAEMLK